MRSSTTRSEQLEALCGKTPKLIHHVILPNDIGVLRTDFRLGLPAPATYCASSLKGPSLPLAWPLTSRHITSHRLVTM